MSYREWTENGVLISLQTKPLIGTIYMTDEYLQDSVITWSLKDLS